MIVLFHEFFAHIHIMYNAYISRKHSMYVHMSLVIIVFVVPQINPPIMRQCEEIVKPCAISGVSVYNVLGPTTIQFAT